MKTAAKIIFASVVFVLLLFSIAFAAADASDGWDKPFWDQWQSGTSGDVTPDSGLNAAVTEQDRQQALRDEIFQSVLDGSREKGELRDIPEIPMWSRRTISLLQDVPWVYEEEPQQVSAAAHTGRYIVAGLFFLSAVAIAVLLIVQGKKKPEEQEKKEKPQDLPPIE